MHVKHLLQMLYKIPRIKTMKAGNKRMKCMNLLAA